MTRTIKVLKIQKGMFYDRVIVEAQERSTARFGSFLGDRKFILREGQRLNLKMKKNLSLVEGDMISMNTLVSASQDWTTIPWTWSY